MVYATARTFTVISGAASAESIVRAVICSFSPSSSSQLGGVGSKCYTCNLSSLHGYLEPLRRRIVLYGGLFLSPRSNWQLEHPVLSHIYNHSPLDKTHVSNPSPSTLEPSLITLISPRMHGGLPHLDTPRRGASSPSPPPRHQPFNHAKQGSRTFHIPGWWSCSASEHTDARAVASPRAALASLAPLTSSDLAPTVLSLPHSDCE